MATDEHPEGREEEILVEAAVPPDAEPRKVRHPKGLSTLFFTEMWERFSYYGMRDSSSSTWSPRSPPAASASTTGTRESLYGTYTGSVWLAAIFGGVIADRLLGQYRSVLLGGVIIAMATSLSRSRSCRRSTLGLALIVIGTGLLKPNVSILSARSTSRATTGGTPGSRSSTWESTSARSSARSSPATSRRR